MEYSSRSAVQGLSFSFLQSFENEDDEKETDLVCPSLCLSRGNEQDNKVVGISFGRLR